MSIRRGLAAAVLGSLIPLLPTLHATPAHAAGMPSASHVFVIVMENHGLNDIIGNTAAPYINSVAATGGVAVNYSAITHPSLPNYLSLTGGDTYGITSDCTTCWVDAPNLADNVEAAGKTWKTYQESMPSPCFAGDSYPYAQKHNPFIYFNDIRNNAARCQGHVVPYSQLAVDLASAATTPNFALITPNNCSDMHDCSVGTGDSWLSQQIPQILGSPAFTSEQSLLAVVWDEDDYSGTNQVPMLLLGSGVSAGFQSAAVYNHYSLLRSIEAALSLPALTSNDSGAATMDDFFTLQGWTRLGGIATSGPGSSSWGAAHTDAFVRGLDGQLYHNWFNGTSWQGFQALGGSLNSDPAAVSWGANRIDVFSRGPDNQLWHTWWDGVVWNKWQPLGGSLNSGPDVSSWAPNRLDVFTRGNDNQLWHTWWDGVRWNNWQPLGGILTSDPTAVSWGPNRIDVFGRGLDNQLWHTWWDGVRWNAWQPLGGILASGPEVTSCASGHLDVFALGGDASLYRLGYNGSSWLAWSRIGATLTADPSAVCPPGTSTVQVFGRWADNSIIQTAVAGS